MMASPTVQGDTKLLMVEVQPNRFLRLVAGGTRIVADDQGVVKVKICGFGNGQFRLRIFVANDDETPSQHALGCCDGQFEIDRGTLTKRIVAGTPGMELKNVTLMPNTSQNDAVLEQRHEALGYNPSQIAEAKKQDSHLFKIGFQVSNEATRVIYATTFTSQIYDVVLYGVPKITEIVTTTDAAGGGTKLALIHTGGGQYILSKAPAELFIFIGSCQVACTTVPPFEKDRHGAFIIACPDVLLDGEVLCRAFTALLVTPYGKSQYDFTPTTVVGAGSSRLLDQRQLKWSIAQQSHSSTITTDSTENQVETDIVSEAIADSDITPRDFYWIPETISCISPSPSPEDVSVLNAIPQPVGDCSPVSDEGEHSGVTVSENSGKQAIAPKNGKSSQGDQGHWHSAKNPTSSKRANDKQEMESPPAKSVNYGQSTNAAENNSTQLNSLPHHPQAGQSQSGSVDIPALDEDQMTQYFHSLGQFNQHDLDEYLPRTNYVPLPASHLMAPPYSSTVPEHILDGEEYLDVSSGDVDP